MGAIIENDWVEELHRLAKTNTTVRRLLKKLEFLEEDMSVTWYMQVAQSIEKLSEELQFINNGQFARAKIIAGDGKVFERVIKLLTESDKIFKSIEEGKKIIIGEKEGGKKKAATMEGVSI